MKKRIDFKFIGIYTVVFAVYSLIIFSPFYLNDVSLVYNKDGWMQYLKLLIYYSGYLRGILKNIFINHTFVIPQWSFSIGEGSDIFTAFQCYAFGDPIALLSVFFNGNNMYVFFIGSIILRLYLAGLAFIYFCSYMKAANRYAIMAGTLTYVFCLWNFFNSVRHLHFLTPMIIFPFMIISIEKLIKENKPLMFTIMVFVIGVVNFFFFCIIVMLVVLYVTVRLLTLYGKNYKPIINKLIKIIIYSVTGVLMAGFVILPMLHSFTDDFRLDIATNIRLIYPLFFYLKLPSSLFSTSRYYWLCMGFAVPVFFALISNFFRRKEEKFLFVMNMLNVFFILTPVFGQITNGMKYITNKWSFAMSLLVAYDLVVEWEYLKEKRKIMLPVYAVLLLASIVLSRSVNITVPMLIGLLFLSLLFYEKPVIYKKTDIKQLALVCLVALCVTFNGFWMYSPLGSYYIEGGTSIEDNQNIMNLSEAKVISELDDKEFFRYSGDDLTKNASLIFGTHSTDYYWSLSNKYVSRYRVDMEIDEYSLSGYLEYGKRPVLYSLANVKYYINPEGDSVIPDGYTLSGTRDGYDLYTNDNYLPFGYTYEKAISYDEWDKLNVVDKEQALTQYVVLDGIENTGKAVKTDSKEISYRISPSENVEINDNYIVSKKDSYIDIDFEKLSDCEVYLSINGLSYEDPTSWLKNPNTETYLNIETAGKTVNSIRYATADDKNQHGRHDFTVYLGSMNKESLDNIRIVFTEAGIYDIDDISIYCMPIGWYEDDLIHLKEDTVKDVKIDDNYVGGNISLTSDKYLVLSIPYSTNWKAYVDGERVETFVANGCYTGLALSSGNHSIELRYSPKLMNIGLVISAVGFGIFACLVVLNKKKQNNE